MQQKRKSILAAALVGGSLLLSSIAAQAHLVSFAWKDNGNGTVTMYGEHWHEDQAFSYSDNGGVSIDGLLFQWVGVINNLDRDDALASNFFTGWAETGEAPGVEYQDWFYTAPLVVGNGEHTFYTGTDCCIDTISEALKFNLTGIVSVPPGTGPGPINSVPVPAAAWLFGSAVLGFLGFNRRNRKVA